MEFKNEQNKSYKTNDGLIYNSRSCAVVNHVIVSKNNKIFVLVGTRGTSMDEPGKLNLPCGYIDWNETITYAGYREVFEETGLNLIELQETGDILYKKYDQPWFVGSEPTQNRQNISMHLGIFVDLNNVDLPELSLENMEENESTNCEWMELEHLLETNSDTWAFGHKEKLIEFMGQVQDYLLQTTQIEKQV